MRSIHDLLVKMWENPAGIRFSTPEAALAGIHKLVADCIEDRRTIGEPIPKASPTQSGQDYSLGDAIN
jgi:hypothetical protein